MYGLEEKSYLPRTVWVTFHLMFVVIAGWLFFADGISIVGSWVGLSWQPGHLGRRMLLIAFGFILFARMTFTAFVLLKRRFDWTECWAVMGAVAFYQLGFAFLGATTTTALSLIDLFAVFLFGLGSFLNTGAELQRKQFKENPDNAGKLYSRGLFGVVRHPNYLGDIVWALGWALLTRNGWALIIPTAAAAGFVFMFIPKLSEYLSNRYGEQYEAWSRRTKRLIPCVY